MLLRKCSCQLQTVYVYLASAALPPSPPDDHSAPGPRWGLPSHRLLVPILYLQAMATSVYTCSLLLQWRDHGGLIPHFFPTTTRDLRTIDGNFRVLVSFYTDAMK